VWTADAVAEDPPAPIVLAHRFLLVGSESVTLTSRPLLPETDYRLDHDAGTIRLARPLPSGDTLKVSYAWVPVELPLDFVALSPGEPTPPDSTRMSAETPGSSPTDRLARAVDENLLIGGAKTFSLEVGSNKDAEVEQSLRVSVTGRIGEDVRLTALLSDQNIPLQPEGETQRIEELDEILIRVDAKSGSATLGDFVARREGTAFGDFERRLSGAEGRVGLGPAGARATGGSTRGNFRTLEFRGEEGKQGPYVLAGEGFTSTGVIVAGSERVWMDGVLLTRGENNDYVVDYSRGEIEFTNRRLVTVDSEIAVDFEFAEQDYRRNFYLGEGSFASEGGGFTWRTSIAAEIEDEDPLSAALTDERREDLKAAGDEAVLVEGATCTGEGGDYVEVDDHFEYVGGDSGTCSVAFTAVGAGLGGYVRDRAPDSGLTFFRFVGDGNGDYAPGLLLPGPRTASLADLGVRLTTGDWKLAADGAVSREDRNTLSSVDDDDNDAAAGKVALTYDRPEMEAFGRPVRFTASTSYRGEEAGFRPLGRTRDAYLGEVWNFADSSRADETVGEVEARLASGDRWSLGGGGGILDRVGRFRSVRRHGDVHWSGWRVSRAAFRAEAVRREDDAGAEGETVSDLLRLRGELTGRLGFLRPGFTYWKEDREAIRATERLTGEDEVEVGGRLGIVPGPGLSADLRVARRTTDIVEESAWVRESVGRTYEVRADATRSRSVRARFSWIRRELDFEEGRDETDRTTHLTRSSLDHESFGGRLHGEYVYETTSRSFARREGVDPDLEEPTLALDASARIRLGAARRARGGDGETPSTLGRVLAAIRSETLARVEEETTTSDRRRIYLLDFSRFQDDATTVFGKIFLRQEVVVYPGSGPLTVTARWERSDTEDNRAISRRVDLLTQRAVLRATSRVGPRWILESQGTRQTDHRSENDAVTGAALIDFDVLLLELREELTWQPRPTTRFTGRGSIVQERNETNGASIRGLTLGLSAAAPILTQGRWTGEASWTRPFDREGVDTADRFQTRGRDQLDWRTSLDVKLSDSIHASFTYSGRSLEGIPATHLARAEARALF
jgi:hypothetical protein